MRKALLLLAVLAASACQGSPSLQGNWSADVDATISRAKSSGLPDSAGPGIREIYEGGLLEITSDTLVMRVSGVPDAIARNYKIVGENGGCYSLEITGTSGTHSYCIEGSSLVIRDPSAKIAVVYSGR